MKSPYGPVYTALDRDTGNEVMWRQIDLGKGDQSNLLRHLDAVTNWLKELQGVIRLDCKNIVNYLSYERRSRNELVLITEMMTRGSFSEYLAGLKQPRMSICQNWFQQILVGLSTLHQRKITHGRLSCEHIFINSNTGEVKIGDLSLVKLEEIISNRLLPHRPIDDIHQFGLLILEIAFAQFLPNPKLKCLINRHYNAMAPDIKKISSLAQYIEDETYKSLLLYCISANSDVKASDVLGHPFFSKVYAREEALKVAKSKGRNVTESSIHLNSVENRPITVVSSDLKPLATPHIDVSLKIVFKDMEVLIKFKYDMDKDSPEKVAQEMREVLELPELYVAAFLDKLKQACTVSRSNFLVSKYRKENAKNSPQKLATIQNLGEEELSMHSVLGTTGSMNNLERCNPGTCKNKQRTGGVKGPERKSLQPNSTFTDLHSVPSGCVEAETVQKSGQKQ